MKVYQQDSPILANRTTTYRYTQEIWVDDILTEGDAFNRGEGILYNDRLDPRPGEGEIESLAENDLDNSRGTRRLIEIIYTVDGKEGNMYVYLGETEEERQKNLQLLKDWVGYWVP